ncbi:MAG: hypothetical protein K8L99_35700, partial [Anaerolineae bacterium]|nr:hypothetical protein [Anaerolineae bacterium]
HEVLYSRVEAAYSPKKRSGYQVVHHSRGLGTETVREIESNIRCFQAANVDTRYQYFQLSTGDIALALSREIEEIDTRIIDKAGRRGPFVAHCVVLDRASFARLENNPFRIFETDEVFVLDVPGMVDVQRKNAETRVVYVDQPDVVQAIDDVSPEDNDTTEEQTMVDYISFDIEGWKVSDFVKLWLSAANAKSMREHNQMLALQTNGDRETEAYELLRLMFHHLSPELRVACTFNTYTDGCPVTPGTYWSVAGTQRIRMSSVFTARLDRYTVDYRPPYTNRAVEDIARSVFKSLREAQGLDDEQ